MSRYNIEWEKEITPLHPNAPKNFTIHDCFHLSRVTGVNPQTIAGVMMGRIKPVSFIQDRLRPHFEENVIDSICNDYRPDRFYNFKDGSLLYPSHYEIENWYPVFKIKNGDCIRCDDGRWIVVSQVIKSGNKVRIFSGDVFCVSVPEESHLIVAVLLKDNVSTKNHNQESFSSKENIRESIVNFDDEEKKRKMVADMIKKLRQ